MAGIELYKKDGTASGVFYCEICRSVYSDQDRADWCHGERLCACGKKVDRGYSRTCDFCRSEKWRKESQRKEAEAFEKATKIPASEYTGEQVYGLDDRYYDCVEDAVDQYLEGQEPEQEPEYVWAVKNVGVPLASSENIIEHLLENMWEEADENDLKGVKELDAAIDAFNKANKDVVVWMPDYSTAVLVEKDSV